MAHMDDKHLKYMDKYIYVLRKKEIIKNPYTSIILQAWKFKNDVTFIDCKLQDD